MIKKIHYCWFGSPKPDSVKKNVEAWEKLNPDFEIVEWNEANIDVSGYEFGERALSAKKWGFLVDTIRPKALFEQGGFYLDADIELVSPLNRLEPEGDKLVMGYMYDCALGTAALYSPQGHPYLRDILKLYRSRINRDIWPVSNSIFTEYFINHVPGFLLNGCAWHNDSTSIHPKEFLEQPAFRRKNGIAIHHYSNSWTSANNGFILNMGNNTNALNHLILWAKRQIRTRRSLTTNEFYSVYQEAKQGRKQCFESNYYTPADRSA